MRANTQIFDAGKWDLPKTVTVYIGILCEGIAANPGRCELQAFDCEAEIGYLLYITA